MHHESTISKIRAKFLKFATYGKWYLCEYQLQGAGFQSESADHCLGPALESVMHHVQIFCEATRSLQRLLKLFMTPFKHTSETLFQSWT